MPFGQFFDKDADRDASHGRAFTEGNYSPGLGQG